MGAVLVAAFIGKYQGLGLHASSHWKAVERDEKQWDVLVLAG